MYREYYIINLTRDGLIVRRTEARLKLMWVPHTDGYRFYRSSEQSYHVEVDFASVVVVLIEHTTASDRDIGVWYE